MNDYNSPDFFNHEFCKNYLAFQKEAGLMNYRSDLQRIAAREKAERDEAASEAKKSQYDDLVFDDEGRPLIVTRNLSIESKPRYLTNFTQPEIIKVMKAAETSPKYFVLFFILNGQKECVFLSESKSQSATYLLRKLRSAGAVITAPSEAREKQYVFILLGHLIRYSTKIRIVPDRQGWFIDDGKILFCKEGELTWPKVEDLAK